MQHANSPLTPNGGLRMVCLVGLPARASGAIWSCLKDRCSRPSHSPSQVPRRGAADLRAPSAHRLERDAAR